MKGAIISLVAALAVAGSMFLSAGAASASSLPKAQTMPAGGWHSGWKVRPGVMYFGAHFLIKGLRWSYWAGSSAKGYGRFAVYPGPGRGYWVNATAYLHDVRYHRGPGRYFRDLRITYGHNHHTIYLHVTSGGNGYYY